MKKTRKPHELTASPELLTYLPEIARRMIEAEKPGLSVHLFNVQLKHLQELGVILLRIANGADARRSFGQHNRRKPAMHQSHLIAALAYWSTRAVDPKKPDKVAILAARATDPKIRKLSSTTIRKAAQYHRPRVLYFLKLAAETDMTPLFTRYDWRAGRISKHDGAPFVTPTEEQMSALCKYLRSKNVPREDVDK